MSEATARHDTEPAKRAWTALLEILAVSAVTALAFALELWLRSGGRVSWGEDSRGVLAVLAGALAAVFLALRSGHGFSDLGFTRPERWATVPLWVLGILVVFVSAQALAPRLLSLVVELPAPDFSRHAAVAGNLRTALTLALLLPFTASIPEEIIYRGFLIGRLEEVFGRSTAGVVATVALQSLIFGSTHFGWGLGGMIMATLMGGVWGTAYLLCGRNLWIMILAHTTGHLLFVAQLYAGPIS